MKSLAYLRDQVQSLHDPAAARAFDACAHALSNLFMQCWIANAELVTGASPGFVIHVMFHSAQQELPLVELRYAPRGEPQLSVHLVALDDGEVVQLSDELMKPSEDWTAATWDALGKASFNIGLLVPPEPTGGE
jgi:hypothetical protein